MLTASPSRPTDPDRSASEAGAGAVLAYMPALDGLRGLAVAAVLAFHTGHFSGGFLGVDLFFVLSGFLITSLLMAEWRATGTIDLRRFWARRARRLLPALFVVLAAVVAYAAVLAAPDELAAIRGDVLATLGYVANWEHIVGSTGEASPFAVLSPLEHTWSLAIEEQFYLVWPLLVTAVLALAAGPSRCLLGVVAVLGAGSALVMAVLSDPSDPARAQFGTDTRALPILAGAGLALVLHRWGPLRSPRARRDVIAGLAAAAALAAAWIVAFGTDDGLYRGGFVLFALAAVIVVAAAAQPEQGPLGRALSFAPLRALGLISYGLYLWHWPVYVVLSASRTGLDGWALNGLRVGVSLALAVASYHVVERPVRSGALRGRGAWVAALASVGAIVAGTLVATSGRGEP